MSFFKLKNGMELFYNETGKGEPVILMHGWTANHEIYDIPAQIIGKKAHVLWYDHRGHGGSKEANKGTVTMETLASDLNEIITGFGLSGVTLVGWSMGAGVALTYIRDYGTSALKQVVLCDMPPRQLNDATWKLGLKQGQYTAEDMKRDMNKPFIYQYQMFIEETIPKLKKLPGFVLRLILRKQLRKCDVPTLQSLGNSMKAQDLREVVEKIDVPFTYFYPKPGSLFTPRLAEWYGRHVKSPFQAVPFEDGTHMFIDEHPEQFAEELCKLL